VNMVWQMVDPPPPRRLSLPPQNPRVERAGEDGRSLRVLMAGVADLRCTGGRAGDMARAEKSAGDSEGLSADSGWRTDMVSALMLASSRLGQTLSTCP
jgi:hypothetical protein